MLTVAASGVQVRGLRIAGSGSNHDHVDAGVKIAGSGNVLEDNLIEDCLFGVDLAQADDNVVRRNRIHSKAVELGFRGDAIRLWYSFRNQIVELLVVLIRTVKSAFRSKELVEKQIAVAFGRCLARSQDQPCSQSQSRTDGRRGPAMIRLYPPMSHKRIRSPRECVANHVFELADLVAADFQARQVIAFHQ